MKILVDTSVWSLLFRRQGPSFNPREQMLLDALGGLLHDNRAVLIGPIRQEFLSGFRRDADFQRMRDALRAFEEIQIESPDYDQAAQFYNQCRSKGIVGSPIDLLICAVADRVGFPILTGDSDFDRYAECLPIRLFR